MSRGHGKVERIILQVLDCRPRRMADRGKYFLGASAEDLVYACRAAGGQLDSVEARNKPRPKPTRAELESVRRALRNLRKQGLIKVTKYRHVIYEMPGKKPRSG